MMARISPEVIDRVREAANIVDVISQYLDLRKRGQNFVGICPFHNDTHPSLYVSPIKEIYKCFACGAGGNVFTFLTEYDKISFVDAVKQLGDKYGIEVQLNEAAGDKDYYTKLYEIHDFAEKTFQKHLFSDKGKNVIKYLAERGLTLETIKTFKLGLSSTGWEDLITKVKSQNYSNDVIEKSGLFTKSDKGIFDRFRNRIMFPIFNQSGKVIAFGGRTLDKNEPAKYVNSPETQLYHKSDVLYGLHLSRQAIREKGVVFLVEGYMDFIQLYQAGIENVVAASGTALAERHVQQIKKFTNRVYLTYDGDQAGTDAAIRAGYLLYQGSIEPLVVQVPKGMDPDDWIRKNGAEAILQRTESATSLIDFQISAKNVENLSSAERSQFVNDILFAIAGINDSIIRNSILKNISQRLQIDENELLKRLKREQIRQRTRVQEEHVDEQPLEFSSLIQKAQLILVKLLANDDPQIRQFVRDNIDLDLFSEPVLKKLAEILLPLYDDIKFSSIIDHFDKKLERELVSKILMEEKPQEDPKQEVTDCIKVLRSYPIKEKIQATRFKIRELEQRGEDPIDAVMEEALLQQELRDLK
ncbi:DNA primase [Candidatus Neomarinimicrobiota bacterium]